MALDSHQLCDFYQRAASFKLETFLNDFHVEIRKLSSLHFISSVERLCVIQEQYLENSFVNEICCAVQPSSNHFDLYFSWIRLNFHIFN